MDTEKVKAGKRKEISFEIKLPNGEVAGEQVFSIRAPRDMTVRELTAYALEHPSIRKFMEEKAKQLRQMYDARNVLADPGAINGHDVGTRPGPDVEAAPGNPDPAQP